ncbi:MAG: recombinase family protein [Clostridiales bacterium]|nr:recombinase family protein [Clostridiales bacterium]
MDSRTYYYARVSSKEQNLDRQIAAFYALGATDRDIITDKESCKDLDRKGYQALKNAMLRRGDTLVVKSLDRLSRNKFDIHNELQYFKENGIRLKVIDLPATMMDLPEGQEWVFEMVNNILIEAWELSQNRNARTFAKDRQRALKQQSRRQEVRQTRPCICISCELGQRLRLLESGRNHSKDSYGADRHKKNELLQARQYDRKQQN